ncbi:hypothetical protein Zmor_014251 [Zophobas morio]|uniref:Uncharacterized protein n=1 Tax=Zophobas morio TaxID=2755281 RepID=A0AA38IH08_9CUCU|nr:hypothetical protein Zmor_014251 [Zophobas morio]
MSRWVTGMLRNSEVPVLWDTVVDSMVRCLNDLGYHTLRYANELVILLTGKNADTLCQLQTFQLSDEVKYLGVVLDWRLNCKKHLDEKVEKAGSDLWECHRVVGMS